MEKLDTMVAEYIEHRLLEPRWLERCCRTYSIAAPSAPSDQSRTPPNCASGRPKADAKLKRLYDAIESGVVDLSDPMLKNQRVEVDQKELRIMGSKSGLLRTLVAASSAKTAGFGVPSSVPKWRR